MDISKLIGIMDVSKITLMELMEKCKALAKAFDDDNKNSLKAINKYAYRNMFFEYKEYKPKIRIINYIPRNKRYNIRNTC